MRKNNWLTTHWIHNLSTKMQQDRPFLDQNSSSATVNLKKAAKKSISNLLGDKPSSHDTSCILLLGRKEHSHNLIFWSTLMGIELFLGTISIYSMSVTLGHFWELNEALFMAVKKKKRATLRQTKIYSHLPERTFLRVRTREGPEHQKESVDVGMAVALTANPVKMTGNIYKKPPSCLMHNSHQKYNHALPTQRITLFKSFQKLHLMAKLLAGPPMWKKLIYTYIL